MQVVVIGAGVVGLAIARQAALAGHDVILVERGSGIGEGISSRNSEVIHAGMYYATGTLRASLCPIGNRKLFEYCMSHNVPHLKCGKLIVATDKAESVRVEAIHQQGLINGVIGLELISGNAARVLEPELSCTLALCSPETGIVDSHALMLALQGDLEQHGGVIAFATPVSRLTLTSEGWEVHFEGAEPGRLAVDAVVNAAGLGAQSLARCTESYPESRVPKLVLAKGNYFGYTARSVFSRLIYPTPVDGGLGVHVTLDMSGRMRFGPDVEWVSDERYEVDPNRAASFYQPIRKYWPGLKDDMLVPDYSGIRPKLSGPGEPTVDFMIEGPCEHGLPRLVHLFGIESPGLTCALPIAEEVVSALQLE